MNDGSSAALDQRLRFVLGRFRDRYLATPVLRPDRLLFALLAKCPLPDFVILGAQKAGTSTLYDFLTRQPGVRGALRKEVGYFDARAPRSLTWYRAFFPPRWSLRNGFLTGEASPNYLFHPGVPERVAAALPAAKFIVILRNPIDRSFSHYRHALRYRTIAADTSFEEALNLEKNVMATVDTSNELDWRSPFMRYSFVSRSFYLPQLERWFRCIERERVLVVRFEDMLVDGVGVLQRVLQFLGLGADVVGVTPLKNPGISAPPMALRTRALLSETFREHNRQLSAVLDMDLADWGE